MSDLKTNVDEEYQKGSEEAILLIDEAFPHRLKSQLKSRMNKLEEGRTSCFTDRISSHDRTVTLCVKADANTQETYRDRRDHRKSLDFDPLCSLCSLW
jgi:hypothetical protein